MNTKKQNNFYIADFVKNLIRPRNIPLILYLLVDSALIFFATVLTYEFFFSRKLQDPSDLYIISAVLSAVLFFGTIALSLSFIGEWYLRLRNHCKRINDVNILNRVEPLFIEVYKKAKTLDPKIPDNIKLYIQEDDDPNAFALGRRTMCITTGLLAYPDDQIKGVLAHEFGHLSHQDTDLLLVVNVANSFLDIIFLGIWIVLIIIRAIGFLINLVLSIFLGDLAKFIDKIFNVIFIVLSLVCIKLVHYLWNIIGNLLLQLCSRGQEFSADFFALQMGYGPNLLGFFRTLPDAEVGKKTKFTLFISKLATIGEAHPATWRRIEQLQQRSVSTDVPQVISENTESNEIHSISVERK